MKTFALPPSPQSRVKARRAYQPVIPGRHEAPNPKSINPVLIVCRWIN